MSFEKDFIEPQEFLGEVFTFARQIRNCKCSENKGVYIIVTNNSDFPEFVYPSPAGWFKGKDPTVSRERLESKWIDRAKILYIGRANSYEAHLQFRMEQHIKFWNGQPVGARGGRLIAQIKNYENLQVWYLECEDPVEKEKELLLHFERQYGKLPFANLRR